MNRGEVWRLETAIARSFPVIIVGNNVLTDVYGRTQVVPIQQEDAALPTLVTVRVSSPVEGIASVADTSPFRVERLTERLGLLPSAEMVSVEVALRAVFDLPPG